MSLKSSRFNIGTSTSVISEHGERIGEVVVGIKPSASEIRPQDVDSFDAHSNGGASVELTQHQETTDDKDIEDISELQGKPLWLLIKAHSNLLAGDNAYMEYTLFGESDKHRISYKEPGHVVKVEVTPEFINYIRNEALQLEIVTSPHLLNEECNESKENVEIQLKQEHEALLQEFTLLKQKVEAENSKSTSLKNLNAELEGEKKAKEELQQKLDMLEKKLKAHPKSKVCCIL